MALTIEPLTPDWPQLEDWLATLGRWHHEHCLTRGLVSSLERRIEQLRTQLVPESIPVTLVAHKEGCPLGAVGLVRYDLAAGAPATLWLSNLYVRTDLRGRGLGSALVEKACAYAREQGETVLWLFTDEHPDFYRRRGWEPTGGARVNRTEVAIFVRRL